MIGRGIISIWCHVGPEGKRRTLNAFQAAGLGNWVNDSAVP